MRLEIARPTTGSFPALPRYALGLLIGIFAATCILSPAWAQSNERYGRFWHMHDGWCQMMGLGGTTFGGAGMLVFWGLIIVLIVLLARGYIGRSPSQFSTQSPRSNAAALDILKERYAKGDISTEEYLERKKTLTD